MLTSKQNQKSLKDLKKETNPSQLGDPVSLKAETSDNQPTDQDRPNKAPEKRSLKEIAQDKMETNPSMLGDPVSLKAETSNTEPTADDRGALGTTSKNNKRRSTNHEESSRFDLLSSFAFQLIFQSPAYLDQSHRSMALLTPPPSTEQTHPSFQLPFYEDIFGSINEDVAPANQVERCETESDSDDDEEKIGKAPSNIGFFKKYAVPGSKRVIRSEDDDSHPSDHGQSVNEGPRYRIDPRISKKHSVLDTPTKLTPKKYGMFGGSQSGKTQPPTKATSAGDEFVVNGGLGEHNNPTVYDDLRAGAGGYTFLGEELGDANDGFQTLEHDTAGSPYETFDQEAFDERPVSEGPRAGAPKQKRSLPTEDRFVSDRVQNAEDDIGSAVDQDELREEGPAPMPRKRGRPRKQAIIDADMIAIGRTRSSGKRRNEQERRSFHHTRSSKRLPQPVVPSKRKKWTARVATSHKAKKTVSSADSPAAAADQGGSKRRTLVRGVQVRAGVGGDRGTRRRRSSFLTMMW
ncbi:hypothetical protein Tdes44962_MAKER04538 [Teratosphaeria destructans]|uniref:Uncharacterized protein n=1 Tax=Teratosphaeria destructans TaxID=418781 RepID=A0A9W7SM24_9PEZI|nr:hypothetical protein Tdes44962_MAKER04538 [Teratosphaeria destructans]